jgi:predicted RNA-binding Zn-ribbon protein involved in translation (DUF1610 family)
MKFSELITDPNTTPFKCPKCGSENIITEKRIDGFSTCLDCKHHDKTGEFIFVENGMKVSRQ